ncbi:MULTISPECIES: DUF4760 domain-containing protein [Klebsiella pneumoniae complex]|uniref:DUF4760 domain-containing protein n=1 Tax=Klebsiella pneumoniae complex TaxID=3390273 RepID=UPI000D64E7C5|nr:DUF4760 domain-containing protein [Klebsiella pneumoniae]HCF8278499.1 DUF4760 domain-containing protein [Klebsiella variicola subsp. variicola]HDF5707076.1 DUF4760 domain-containing protein [Klebsiella variicola]MBK2923297.1 DUF4760 domain-containing protein [Klebsiella pneumoniae]MBK2938866.1 DUF4760 domain-containing protein [Klebsiella pneumoniae]MBK2942775.1 DUF4760 domain-containing protein [Klebsiella pneumoniae]
MEKITQIVAANPQVCELSFLNKLLVLLTDSPTFYPAAIGVIVAVVSIWTQRRTSREKNSLDFEISYKRSDNVNAAFTKLRPIVTKKFEIPLSHWGKLENAATDEAKALRTIFNEWERCANAVRNKIYDSDYLYKVYGSTVLDLDMTFGEYIAECQSWNERVYRNFKWLALKWKIKRCKEDLKPSAKDHIKKIKQAEKILKDLERSL